MPNRALCSLALVVALIVAPTRAGEIPEFDGPAVVKNATVIPAPGQIIENAHVVIVGGRITAVGANAMIPAGARVIDGTGLFVYAGFIDGLSRAGLGEARGGEALERRVEDEFLSTDTGPRTSMDLANRHGIFAQRSVNELLDVKDNTFDDARRAGFTSAVVAPPKAILSGNASLLQLGDRPVRRSLLRSNLWLSASLDPPGQRAIRGRDRYPSTGFGVTAHLRQFFYDAAWLRELEAWSGRHSDLIADLPSDDDLRAIRAALDGARSIVWEVNDSEEILRALRFSDEFKLKPMIAGATEAYKVLDELKARRVSVFVSLRWPGKAREYKLDARELRKSADDSTVFGKNWTARPFWPKSAFDAAAKYREELVRNAARLDEAGIEWCVMTDGKKPEETIAALREAIEAGLKPDAALRALTTTPARLVGAERDLGSIEPGKRANLVVLSHKLEAKEAKTRYVFVDGKRYEFDAEKKRDRSGEKGKDGERGAKPGNAPTTTAEADSQAAASSQSATTDSQPAPTPVDDILLHEPLGELEFAADRDPGIRLGGNALLTNVTVLTISGDDIPNGSILIRDGKIATVGKDIQAPAGVTTLDLSGCTVMPGAFDPHSHIALDAVNEFSLSVVPEVRCSDVVRPDDVDIYRALAGGCTIIHAMHGSANAIGGQNVVLKMKWGRPSDELIVHAPRSVKFATGENVTRSGRPRGRGERERDGGVGRFPGTRMGVETVVRRAFHDARAYAESRAAAQRDKTAGKDPRPLRRDVRLDALADILSGDIWVNMHCYRADEVLRIMQVCEDFGVRISNLHHILEGYRIMPEIARLGAGTCTFADWWAYKVEAYDAIPFNAGMLLRAGVNSMIKSDSSDLMRHLPLETAKALRYSGLSSNEALSMITLNAARGFGLESRVGSIEVGKDADLAVYDGHPLDTFAKCVLTIIEGEVYFRHRDFDPRTRQARPARPEIGPFTSKPGPGIDLAESSAVDPKVSATGAYAIVLATVHPISKPVMNEATVLIQDGKIVAVGQVLQIPAGAVVIDGKGLHVYPGLINAATTVGLNEVGMVDVTVDTGETGTYQPDIHALSAFNPHSAMVEVTRAEGITTCLIVPESPTIAGQAGLIDLDGWSMPEMRINDSAALVISLPGLRAKPLLERESRPDAEHEHDEPVARRRSRDDERENEEAQKALRTLRDLFEDARLYAAEVEIAAREKRTPATSADPRLDALIPYVTGKRPVLFRAESYQSILEALLFAEQAGVRPVILGGRDAWRAADLLSRRRVPVIYDSVFDVPREVPGLDGVSEAWDANYRAAGLLARGGVEYCFANGSASLAKLVPVEAGFAVEHGLDADAAVRAMTLSAAEILGIADRYGSLDVGKVANVIVTTGHPGQVTSVVRHVFIRGRPVSLMSKHTREAIKFANRPKPELPPAPQGLKGNTSRTISR
ncbi:MAG: amidohydrolase family protein [Phycisphaerales bacterium]|nr:amidohydrolase family protein [Phycisphaerales bacterium]